tara:strand:+ start:93 stop:428 length:336 start_codon:yes stop_codon:yes gene_type:complete
MKNLNETFEKELKQAVRDQSNKNKYADAVESFKEKYRHILKEGKFIKLPSGEKFSKGTATPAKDHGAFDKEKAFEWFTSAIREKRVTRKEFNAITKKDNGRKASLSIKGKS